MDFNELKSRLEELFNTFVEKKEELDLEFEVSIAKL